MTFTSGLMPGKRDAVERAIAKLREIEKLRGQGISIAPAAKRFAIADQTF